MDKSINAYDIKIIELQPDDKMLVLFNPEWMDLEQAIEQFKQVQEYFSNYEIIGLYGADVKIIREEEIKNAENNFKKHLEALYKNM